MNTYTCQNILNLLPLYTEGKTSDEVSMIIEEHLNSCPYCFEKYLALKDVSTRIKIAFENMSNADFVTEQHFVRDNISAFIDNELSSEDYMVFNQYTVNNEIVRKDLEDMMLFEENLQRSLEKNKQILEKDLSKSIVKKVKKDSQDYLYEQYIKAAIITIILLSVTILAGYFSIPDNLQKLSALKDKNYFSLLLEK